MLSLAVAILVTLPVNAADWREFRGPEGRGAYEGKPLPTRWGPATNVTWKTPIPGRGWSSPILVQGKLVVTTAVPDAEKSPSSYSLRALCFDAGSGKRLWEKEVLVEDVKATPQPHKKNSHASPTPVSDGKLVWVHFGHVGTACLDLAGNIVWKAQALKYIPVHGAGGSRILVDDLLVFNCDGAKDPFIVALDQRTGKVRWKTPRNTDARQPFAFATCQLITHGGRRMIVSPASDYCMGYDPEDGHELWRVKYPKPGWSLICRPVYAQGLVFVCTGYTAQHLIAFEPSGAGDITGKIAWRKNRRVANTPSPIAVGKELYMISDAGVCTCFDAKTGKEHWSNRLAGGAYSASPIHHDGKLYLTSENGVGQIIAADPKAFKDLGRYDLGETTFATFVPSAGSLFVRTETKLYRFDETR